MSPTDAANLELSVQERVRRVAFYISVFATVAAILIVTGELFFLLVLGFFLDEVLGDFQLHVMAIAVGVFFAFLGLLVQFYKPTRQVASFQAVAAFLGISTLLYTIFPNRVTRIFYPFVAAMLLIAYLHPSKEKLLPVRDTYSPPLLTLSLLAAIPLLSFAAHQLGLQQPNNYRTLYGYYTMMAAVPLTILAASLLVALLPVGYRLLGWLIGFLAGYFGLLSVVLPPQASSVGVAWGVLTIVWAITLVVITELTVRNEHSPYFNRELGDGEKRSPAKPTN